MRASDLEALRSRLQHRRRLVLSTSRRAAAQIDELRGAERDPEVEEGSQSEQVQYDLSRLGEVEQQEIARIDAALERMDAGQYGICRGCGEAIEPGRLSALPFALDCADCADRREVSEALARERAGKPRRMAPE